MMANFILQKKRGNIIPQIISIALGCVFLSTILIIRHVEPLATFLIAGNITLPASVLYFRWCFLRKAKTCTIEISEDGLRQNTLKGSSYLISWPEITYVREKKMPFSIQLIVGGRNERKIIADSGMNNFEALKQLLSSKVPFLIDDKNRK